MSGNGVRKPLRAGGEAYFMIINFRKIDYF